VTHSKRWFTNFRNNTSKCNSTNWMHWIKYNPPMCCSSSCSRCCLCESHTAHLL